MADTIGYNVDSAPWADEPYEICPVPLQNGMRAVLFEPVIEEWSYEEDELSVNFVYDHESVKEVVVKSTKTFPGFFLTSQKIAYLDNQDYWINSDGIRLTDFDDIESLSGEKSKPEKINLIEQTTYKTNFEREHEKALEMMLEAPPCTKFTVGHYDRVSADIMYDFGSNNPLTCGEHISFKQSTLLNYTETLDRAAVSYTDSSNYFVKFPSGDVKTYRAYFPIWEVTHDETNTPICDWNDLGNFKGYDLME